MGKHRKNKGNQWPLRALLAALFCLALCYFSAALGEGAGQLPLPGAEEPQLLQSWQCEENGLRAEICQYRVEQADRKLTYYVAHVYVQKPSQLIAAFAMDAYGKRNLEDTLSIAQRHGAVVAINGDYYNYEFKKGTILRNGVLHRDLLSDRDMMYIDSQADLHGVFVQDRQKDGVRQVTGAELEVAGALHAFDFGPILVMDGKAVKLPETYFVNTDDNTLEPRTAIGQAGPLHYVLLVVDGRRPGWSDEGMTMAHMQQVFLREGCTFAYNLDGGGSSTLVYAGEVLNMPAGSRGQREVADIIGFSPLPAQ